MSELTTEQRPAMAARMKANSGEQTSTSTSKSCLTKEQLEKGRAFERKDKECTQTVVTSNGNKMELRLECEIENVTMSGWVLKNAGCVVQYEIDEEPVDHDGKVNKTHYEGTITKK